MHQRGNRFHDPTTVHPRLVMSALAIAASVLLASAATGCYAGYGTGYYGTTPVVAQANVEAPPVEATFDAPGVTATVGPQVAVQPQLVSIAPTVQVVADYDEPIFYTGGFYWRETGTGWYRSSSYTGGWSYYNDAPYALRTIENRHTYRNYRPAGYVRQGYNNVAVRDHRYGGYDRSYRQPAYQGTVVRDHRGYNNGYDRGYQQPVRDHRSGYDRGGYQQPVVRDHRNGYDRGGYQQPVVRDHRDGYGGGGTYNRQPVVRDNRSGYSGDTRSYRPVVRDNRSYSNRGTTSRGTRSYSSDRRRR
jgi:hypothetical protein